MPERANRTLGTFGFFSNSQANTKKPKEPNFANAPKENLLYLTKCSLLTYICDYKITNI